MTKKIALLIFFILTISGCATINFSANYYTPPDNYLTEVKTLWNKVTSEIPLEYKYSVTIARGQDSKKLKGIPAISNNIVILPEEFIKYVYQNYYNDRNIIFTCTIVHEVSHTEFNLPSSPPEQHFQTDVKAIQLLGSKDSDTTNNYYKSLQVMRNYWFARKGMAGHALNVGWNALNVAALVFLGHGYFVDWFATDLTERLNLISKGFSIPSGACFKRSKK